MKTKKIFILALLPLLFSSCVIREPQKKSRSIEVSGTGEIFVQNDSAKIELSVITKNADVLKASSENAAKMTAVQNALAEKGIEKSEISTSGYSIYQESNYQNGRSVLGAYNVTNRISVVLKDVSKSGEIIDSAIKAGANQLNSVTYFPSSTDAAKKQARILAVKQAEAKANTIATSSGNLLGKLLTIKEENSSFVYDSNSAGFKAESSVADSTTAMSSGKTKITVSISATYELE